MRGRFVALEREPVGNTPAGFAACVPAEKAKAAEGVKARGLKLG